MPAQNILIILHQEHSIPGRVGRLLAEQGFTLDIRRPRFGDPLPKHMHDHAGAVIFGGPMSANDSDDYIKQEIDWIGVPLKESKPFLGICLGAQMLTRHLGGRVYTHPNGRVEIGYYPIFQTERGACTEIKMPPHVYQWHREGFELPTGAELLASGTDFHVQAYQYGNCATAIQFHPEVTYAIMCRWTTHAADRMEAPGAKTPDEHLHGWFQHDEEVARWSKQFLKNWAGQTA